LDAQIPSRNVIGGYSCDAYDYCKSLYNHRFPGTPLFAMRTSEESEAIKLFTNGFFAVKISYFNEIEKLVASHDWNWGRILNAIIADGRITRSHTMVPGPDGLAGYGGRCLPGWYSVKLEDGTIIALDSLKELVEKFPQSRIQSTNGDCSNIEYKRVLKVVETPYKGELVVFDVNGEKLACTPDHLLPVERAGRVVTIRAEEVKITDKLFWVNNAKENTKRMPLLPQSEPEVLQA
jgi:UDP-glucose 6-dehydrogenase